MSPLLFPLLVGLAFLLILFSIILLRRAEGDPLARRIDEFAEREEPAPLEEIELSIPITDRLFVPLVRRISNFVVRLTPQSTIDRTARNLVLTGSMRNVSPAMFLLMRFVTTIGIAGLGYLIAVRPAFSLGRPALNVLIGGIFGYLIPGMYLQSLIDRRKQNIIKKLPDALDLMTICVDAGLTFDLAMQKVDDKWDDELAFEFGRVVHEMTLGISRRQALRDLTERLDVPDVTTFVAAILQAEQLGVGVAKVLRIQANQMRVRRRQRAEEKAQRAPVQILFPLIFLIFPTILIVLLGPALFQILRTPALQGIF